MSPSRPVDVELLLAQASWVPAIARHLVRDASRAEDLAQDTWLAALQHAPRAASARGLRAWLYVVARNLARHAGRRERDRRAVERRGARHEAEESRIEAGESHEEVESVERQKLLAEAVLALAEPYRAAIVLRYFENLSYDAIAERQGVNAAAARKRVSRGLALLREQLDRRFDGDRAAWCLALAPLAARRVRAAPPATVPGGVLVGATAAAVLALVALGATLVLRADDALPAAAPALAAPEPAQPPASLGSRSEAERVNTVLPEPEHSSSALADRDRDLHGVVLDETGRPLHGAAVEVRRDEGREYPIPDGDRPKGRLVGRAPSDERGEFAFPLPAGRPHDLFVTAPGRAPAILSGRVAGERVVVRLGPPAVLQGRVRRMSDGSPVEGARLYGWTGDYGFHSVLDGRTDADGSFRFEGLPAGTFGLQVMPEDDSPLSWIPIELAEGQTTTLDVPLAQGLKLEGRVTDAATGLAIEGATVGLGWRASPGVRTDAEGRYALRGFSSAGHHEVRARADGYAEASRLPPRIHDGRGVIEVAGRTVIDFALAPERVVSGRVLDAAGRPVESAYVAVLGRCTSGEGMPEVDCRSSTTDAGGRYAVRGLRAGVRHSLFVRREGFGTAAYEIAPRNAEELAVGVPDVRLEPAALVAGTAVDERGRPLAGCEMWLEGLNADWARFAGATGEKPAGAGHVDRRRGRTDDLGRFSFADIAPGDYRAIARIEDVEAETRVRVEPGLAPVHARVVLATGLEIAGRAVGEDGRPVGGATVLVRREVADLGRPEVAGIAQAELALIAQEVAGTSRAEDGDAPLRRPASAERRTRTDSDGRFRVLGLEPGPHAVVIRPDRWTASETARELLAATIANVDAGGAALEAVLPRGVRIAGAVRDARGRPVSLRLVRAFDPWGNELERARTRADGSFALAVPTGAVVDLVVEPRTSASDGDPDPAAVRLEGIAAGALDLVLSVP